MLNNLYVKSLRSKDIRSINSWLIVCSCSLISKLQRLEYIEQRDNLCIIHEHSRSHAATF